jgi:Tfp pilus assembly protein PilN
VKAVNLIPAERRSTSGGIGRSGGAVYVILGALAGLLLMTTLYAVASHQVADRKAQLVKATRDSSAATARASQLAPYKQFSDLRNQREQAIVTLAGTRFDWPTLMRNLASALPAGVTLSTFEGNPAAGSGASPGPAGPAAATAVAGGGPSVHVVGCADSHTQVGDIINRLRGVPGVITVAFTSSTKAAPGAVTAAASGGGSSGSCQAPGKAQFDLGVAFSASGSSAPSGSSPSSAAPAPAGTTSPTPTAAPAGATSPTPTAAPATGSH